MLQPLSQRATIAVATLFLALVFDLSSLVNGHALPVAVLLFLGGTGLAFGPELVAFVLRKIGGR